METTDVPAWECSESDRPRYLRWVWEVSHLPWVFVALGENRDAFKLKLARAWKSRVDEWCREQWFLEQRGNKNAWNFNAPTREKTLNTWKLGGTEDDIEDGTDLMLEIGYYGISDEWRTDSDASSTAVVA